jgi:di/tricarboxylate transporter
MVYIVFLLDIEESFLDRSMAGLMGVTAFLSMWINNSAATNIMIPTAMAIVNELENYHRSLKEIVVSNENNNHENSTDNTSVSSTSELYLYLNV